jgi:hypothetical protein
MRAGMLSNKSNCVALLLGPSSPRVNIITLPAPHALSTRLADGKKERKSKHEKIMAA